MQVGVAPDRVYRACRRLRRTGELLPRLSTLTSKRRFISVALSLGSPPAAVSRYPALWGSDFPPGHGKPCPGDCPIQSHTLF